MARRIVALTGSNIIVKGGENLPKDQTVLYVANHQSYMDIPVMMSVIEQPVGFVAKEEIGKIPFFSKWIVHMKCVLIARGDARKALTAILQAGKFLRKDIVWCCIRRVLAVQMAVWVNLKQAV